MTIYRKETIVLSEEGYLVFFHIPFFPIHKCICIVHDYRDPLSTNTKPGFFKKMYYQMTNTGYKKLDKAAAVVAVSDFTADTLTKMQKSKIHTIYN